MFTSGNVTVCVSNFDRAVEFYAKTLGLKLACRYGNEWAEVETPGLRIGLHPAMEHQKPGVKGSMSIGFGVQKLEPAIAQLRERGVSFQGDVVESDPVRLAFFGDPDGNPLYLVQSMESAESCGECSMADAKKPAKAARPKAKAKSKSRK
jgi:predicted enzyme related to lactoylglutathione lyase